MSMDLLVEWASDRAGMGGEEGEHTLYFDPDDVDRIGLMQVWHDTADDDGRPLIGFFASLYTDHHEFRFDLSPDQALDLAAMLIDQVDSARCAALARLADEETEGRDDHG